MTLAYPICRMESAHVSVAGVGFADPYAWLENDSEDVKRWQEAQAMLASCFAQELIGFAEFRQKVADFNTERYFEEVPLPRFAGGAWFRLERSSNGDNQSVIVSDAPMGSGRTVYDPARTGQERIPFISWISPSPDGKTLAVGLCYDGSENNRILLLDTATGETLPHPPEQLLMDNWTGGVHWLPDSKSFFFSAILGRATDFEQHCFLHRRHPTPSTERLQIQWTTDTDYRMISVSPDGQYAVAFERQLNPIPIALAKLTDRTLEWRPFVTTVNGTLAGHILANRFIGVTDIDAARGRVVSIALDIDDPNDAQSWQTLVPESESVIRTVTPVGDAIYLSEYINTYSRVRIFDISGQPLGEVPLPGNGAVIEGVCPLRNLYTKSHPNKFVYAFSSLLSSRGLYCHSPGEDSSVVLKVPEKVLNNCSVEDLWAVASDGVAIPFHCVRRADSAADKCTPTLICGYGAFNAIFVAQFPGPIAAFIEAGGTFIHAHLRGGGEFGLHWARAGQFENKQRSFDDLYTIAEYLIAQGRAEPATLAVMGESAGGLMAAVAATQRPELWGAAIARVPFVDLIGACKDPYGRMGIALEMADIRYPEEVRRLASFSPYYLAQSPKKYPAVYLSAGATDPRCPPWHARKLAARLQANSTSSSPVLLHVWENAGHGLATDRETAITENTEWLAFVMLQLGMVHIRGA